MNSASETIDAATIALITAAAGGLTTRAPADSASPGPHEEYQWPGHDDGEG